MALRLKSVRFRQFRNHKVFELSDIGDLTVLVGQNGVGKTNILEGIQLLVSGTSFRHAPTAQLIQEEQTTARLEGELVDENRLLSISLSMEDGRKRYEINGKGKQLAEVRGLVPTISFVPDDMSLIKGSSAGRRDALDERGSQLSASYSAIHQDYERVVKHKNKLLKEEASESLLDSIDEMVVTCGSQLFCYRVALFNRILPFISKNYENISDNNEELTASYVPSWGYLEDQKSQKNFPAFGGIDKERIRDMMRMRLHDYRPRELERKRSLVGPHNDKIYFYLDGKDASSFASQGQQRSIVLSWKMAEADLTTDMTGSKPVLLLDDVLSELDTTRRHKLVSFVDCCSQAFMTATDLSFFPAELAGKASIVGLSGQEG